jgi:DNA primase large subunit
VNEIVDKAKGKHYQIACGMTFEAVHGGKSIEQGVQHPNQWFQESRNALGFGGKDENDAPTPGGEPVTPGTATARPARPSVPASA